MYKLTARQILMIAFTAAVFAVAGVIGFQQIYNRLPFGSAANVAPLANITDPALATDEQNNIEVYKAISPGVVNVSSTTMVRGFFGLMVEPEEGTCSGSVIDDQGDILTNYHCIENVQKLTVSLGGGKKYPARVVGGVPEEGTCSGSVIDDQGDILTNYHCIENVQKLTVSLGGGKKYPARVVGGDPDTDLAVIRLAELPKEPLTLVPLGDSDKLSVGQKVLAIGN